MATEEQKLKIKAWQAAHKDKLKEYAARHKAKMLATKKEEWIKTGIFPVSEVKI